MSPTELGEAAMPIGSRVAVVVSAAALLASVSLAPTASGSPTWAPADDATVHPGVQTYTVGAQCTANFVFTDRTDVFIGQAAHCSGTGSASDTDGCASHSLPLGTPVEVAGASRPGVVVYNSWLTMQEVGEADPDTCASNDFALVRLDPADHDKVNPSMPFWGGPTGVGGATSPFEKVYSYGSSELRLGLPLLSPKIGFSLGTTGAGWTHPLYTLTPGIPGDSGAPVLDSEGQAVGVVSTLVLAPLPGSNNVTDVGRALAYANAHDGLDVELVPGTEAFSPLLSAGR